jgi:RNA polymerase sigma factor (sigma-70 family)
MVIARRKYSRFLQKQKRQFDLPEEEEEWERLLRQNDGGYEAEQRDYSDVLLECQEDWARHFRFENTGELVERLLPLVNEAYRVAVRARFIEEQSYEEIGQQMDISLDNARTKVHRGLKQLRKLLKNMS